VQRAGLGAMGGPRGGGGLTGQGGADPSDVYGSYRNLRSGAYHEMISSGGGQSNSFRGGR
jgi:hypothetical protein